MANFTPPFPTTRMVGFSEVVGFTYSILQICLLVLFTV